MSEDDPGPEDVGGGGGSFWTSGTSEPVVTCSFRDYTLRWL